MNGNGAVSGIQDSLALLSYSFLGGSVPPCLDAADVDGNNQVQGLSDTLRLLSYAFTGGATPPAPGPTTCGQDPNEDNLSCDEPPAACN